MRNTPLKAFTKSALKHPVKNLETGTTSTMHDHPKQEKEKWGKKSSTKVEKTK